MVRKLFLALSRATVSFAGCQEQSDWSREEKETQDLVAQLSKSLIPFGLPGPSPDWVAGNEFLTSKVALRMGLSASFQ